MNITNAVKELKHMKSDRSLTGAECNAIDKAIVCMELVKEVAHTIIQNDTPSQWMDCVVDGAKKLKDSGGYT